MRIRSSSEQASAVVARRRAGARPRSLTRMWWAPPGPSRAQREIRCPDRCRCDAGVRTEAASRCPGRATRQKTAGILGSRTGLVQPPAQRECRRKSAPVPYVTAAHDGRVNGAARRSRLRSTGRSVRHADAATPAHCGSLRSRKKAPTCGPPSQPPRTSATRSSPAHGGAETLFMDLGASVFSRPHPLLGGGNQGVGRFTRGFPLAATEVTAGERRCSPPRPTPEATREPA